MNAVVELEAIPDVMKRGVVVPVYKGGGKDPLKIDSHRGITLTSMLAKVLEFLLQEHWECVFLEACLLHIKQTAYRRAVYILCRCDFCDTRADCKIPERRQPHIYVPM